MRYLMFACLLCGLLWPWSAMQSSGVASGDEPTATPDAGEASEDGFSMDLVFKTGGGTQLWTDHVHRKGYRIQQNALTGHWRLLDANNIRKCWGSRETCETKLDEISPQVESDRPRHVVVLLHGLMRSRGSMSNLEAKLKSESYSDVVRFSYASTRASIADHAHALREVLEGMPEDTQFSFVGHSMGNIVTRHMLGDLAIDDPKGVLPRCHAMVMLGPPNQGAAIARRLATTGIFGMVTGKGGMELGPHWQELETRLAVPSFPFTIVAGDLAYKSVAIRNPLLDGSGDLVVSVEETFLEGAKNHETVPVLHSVLMNDERVQEITIEFLDQHGPENQSNSKTAESLEPEEGGPDPQQSR